MTCKNCGSNDIIGIQSQNYCINCGQLVSGSLKKTIVSNAVDAGSPTTASRQTTPLISKFPRTNNDEKKAVTDDILPVAKNKNNEFTRKPLLDLRDNASATPIKAHTYRFILKLSLKVAIPLGAFLALALYFKVDLDIVLYGAVGGISIIWLAVMALHSALLYGSSKARDGRVIPESQWWTYAKSRFSELLIINVATTVGITILCVAAYGFYAMSQHIPQGLIGLHIVSLLMANLFICWLIVGLLCIRRLIVAIVTIGGQPVIEACRMAWGMYQDYGGHLILTSAETLLVKLIGALTAIVTCFGAYMISQSNQGYEPFAYGLAALVSIIVWFMVFLRFEVIIWLSRYRWIASQQPASVKSQLLAGGAVR